MHSGYIGLQAHTGRVAFRNIRILAAPTASPRAHTALVSDLNKVAPVMNTLGDEVSKGKKEGLSNTFANYEGTKAG